MEDYLTKYITDDGFDISRLMNDDFFEAIKILFNAGKYVSSCKLLMSAVDTLGFIKYGYDSDAFKKWLADYVDLSAINISVDELWEYRNALLHMTNMESKKIKKGLHPIIIGYVVRKGYSGKIPTPPAGEKHFNIMELINIIAVGISKFTDDFLKNQKNVELFVERYDSILSDSRYLWIHETN